MLLKISLCAWAHINLLGYYQFCDRIVNKAIEQSIKLWDWRKAAADTTKNLSL